MKRLFIILLCLSTWVTVTIAGTITGTVRARGKPQAEQDAAGGKYDSRKYKFLERVNYDEIRDFIVYIDQPFAEKPVPPTKPVEVVVQKDGMFKPHVMPIVVGTTVEWPNHDEIFHNVFSMSESKPFDLGLYKDVVKRITFDKPGLIDVFCSIHAQMHCIIMVLENPYFAATDTKGRFTISNVPAGKYRLRAWHERIPSDVKEITVPENGEVNVDFVLEIKNLPKY